MRLTWEKITCFDFFGVDNDLVNEALNTCETSCFFCSRAASNSNPREEIYVLLCFFDLV